MLKFETGGTMKEERWARPCDSCRSAAASVYCRADVAYLCSPCDGRIHPAASSLHERVWLCESCERAPAAFLCKADSASLCAACDADIHSANPPARRHHRVPVQPIPLCCPSPVVNPGGSMMLTPEAADDEDEDEAASWLLLNPMKNDEARPSSFAAEFDEYLDLDDFNQFSEGYSCNKQQQQQQSSYGGDSIVPIKYEVEKGNNNHCFQLGYTYPPSISQTGLISSMDVGVVPESAHTSTRPPKGTIDLFSSPLIQAPSQLSPMDREARVLRYREKKKTRKFEKTIRYASRKAYAETRPRIKGRFAKRRGQVQVDQIFSSQSLMSPDTTYGVVPSF